MRNRSRVVGIIRMWVKSSPPASFYQWAWQFGCRIFVLPNPSLASEAELFINFLTDVTNEKPTTVGSKIASGLAEFDISIAGGGMLALGIENFLADEKVLGVFLSKMYVAYKENKWVAD